MSVAARPFVIPVFDRNKIVAATDPLTCLGKWRFWISVSPRFLSIWGSHFLKKSVWLIWTNIEFSSLIASPSPMNGQENTPVSASEL